MKIINFISDVPFDLLSKNRCSKIAINSKNILDGLKPYNISHSILNGLEKESDN